MVIFKYHNIEFHNCIICCINIYVCDFEFKSHTYKGEKKGENITLSTYLLVLYAVILSHVSYSLFSLSLKNQTNLSVLK